MSPKRIASARLLLWLGAFAPIVYTVGKTVDDIGGASGVGWLDAVRGGGGAVCFVLAVLVAPKTVRRLRGGLPEAGLLMFIAVGFLSVTWSVSAQTTFLKMVPFVATLLCMARLTSMYESGKASLSGVVTGAHVILMATLVQLVISPSTTFSGSLADPIPRLHSNLPAISSNIFGLVVGIGIAGLVLKVGPRWTQKQPLAFLLFTTYFVMLMATRSRMVTVVALVIMAFLLLKAMHTSETRAAGGWIFIGGVIFAVGWLLSTDGPVPDAIREFALRGQEGGSGLTTLTGRTVLWERALPLWQLNPWTGYGYYSGHRIGLALMDGLFAGYSNLDNTWVETLVDVGIFGAAGLFIFAIFGTLRVMRCREFGRTRPIAVLVALGVVALSFVNPTIQTNTSTLIFFAALVFASRAERAVKLVFRSDQASLLVHKSEYGRQVESPIPSVLVRQKYSKTSI